MLPALMAALCGMYQSTLGSVSFPPPHAGFSGHKEPFTPKSQLLPMLLPAYTRTLSTISSVLLGQKRSRRSGQTGAKESQEGVVAMAHGPRLTHRSQPSPFWLGARPKRAQHLPPGPHPSFGLNRPFGPLHSAQPLAPPPPCPPPPPVPDPILPCAARLAPGGRGSTPSRSI